MKILAQVFVFLSSSLFATHLMSANDEFIPNDPMFSEQWGLKSTLGFDIGATKAWVSERGSKKIAIVVIGTGIDYNHPDLINNMWTNPGEIPNDGIDNDNNGYIDDIHGINAISGTGDPMDDHGHETFVAGVIGAEGNNGKGIAGVMHNVSLIACKFLDKNGSGTTQDAIRCLDYAADLATRNIGVQIVATNNAWGGGEFSQALLDAIKRHHDLGILFVSTSGGDAQSLDQAPVYPAAYNAANIIVTAAMEKDGTLASFSSFGPNTVHVAAPGQNIVSTTLNGGYDTWSGSPATGFVSGIIGLMKSSNAKLSAVEIKQQLMATVLPLATPEEKAKLISGGLARAFEAIGR